MKQSGFGTKSKIIIIAVILVVVGTAIYVWASTTYVNEMNYIKRAYAIHNQGAGNAWWDEAKVTLVKLKDESYITPSVFNAKFSRALLFLNGGYAVKVEVRTDMDGLLGPVLLDFNPFTQQYIGGAPRY